MTQPRPQREIVEFPPNIPVTVALQYAQGKAISNQYGERMMFSTVDGRVLFLDIDVASQIEALQINVRENFSITKQTSGKKDSPVTWVVSRALGEQPNGTLVVPALPHGAVPALPATPIIPAAAASPKPPASAAAPSHQPGRALVEEANALVDAFAEVLHRALTKYEGRVKPDEVRSMLLATYINSVGGKHRAA
jgi:hypothetical protein